MRRFSRASELFSSRRALAPLVLFVGLLLCGCSRGPAQGSPAAAAAPGAPLPKRVIASFYPLAYAAERVAPAGTVVRSLTPAGAEPHDLELTAADLEAARSADLVIYAAGMQPALDRALLQRSGATLNILSLPDLALISADGSAYLAGGARPPDPHVWLDPRRYTVVARAIARALGDEAGATAFAEDLRLLDGELEAGLATCQRRGLVTTHAAFGYIADRYHLRQIALAGFTPEIEPAPADLAGLIEAARAEGSRAVFVEPLMHQNVAALVARRIGAELRPLDPLEVLSGPGYFEVMRVNLESLRQGLECTPSSSSKG